MPSEIFPLIKVDLDEQPFLAVTQRAKQLALSEFRRRYEIDARYSFIIQGKKEIRITDESRIQVEFIVKNNKLELCEIGKYPFFDKNSDTEEL